MEWLYQGKPLADVPEKAVGFVYLITNLETGRKYLGKKTFWSSKRKQVKGKKKKYKVESDWRDYYGSSEEVQGDVASLGEDAFQREILRICYSKGECSYFEAKLQFQNEVLEHPDEWYNGWISVRIRRNHMTWVKKSL